MLPFEPFREIAVRVVIVLTREAVTAAREAIVVITTTDLAAIREAEEAAVIIRVLTRAQTREIADRLAALLPVLVLTLARFPDPSLPKSLDPCLDLLPSRSPLSLGDCELSFIGLLLPLPRPHKLNSC